MASGKDIPVIRYCQVISVDDPTGADRIKVALMPEDNHKVGADGKINIDDVDYCIPVLPGVFHVKPKVGEGCLVLTAIGNDGNSQRYYIGPVISQPHHMEFDPYFMGADSQFRGAWKKPDPNPKEKTNTKGVYPEDDDIAIEGRKLIGIQLTENDVRIKAGVKQVNKEDNRDITFNSKNPAYIKLKYKDNEDSQGNNSVAAMVADQVLLLGHDSRFVSTGLTDNEDLITDKTLDEIYTKAQRLPYGDELISLLKLMVNAFLNHKHPYVGLPPVNSDAVINLRKESARLLQQEELVSNVVRIN